MKFLKRKDTILGVLDHPKDGLTVEDAVQVRGWVISRTNHPLSIEVEVDGVKKNVQIRRTQREEVSKLHAQYAAYNPEPGYFGLLSTHSLPAGRHTLTVRAKSRRASQVIGQAKILVAGKEPGDDTPDPFYLRNEGIADSKNRLLFVHIPKTAGTSLAAYLAAHYPENWTLSHAENQILGRSRAEVGRLDDYHLITAHLKLDTIQFFFDTSDYFCITVLRDPVKQLASHLAWVKRLADPAKRDELAKSPEYIQRAVERIEKLDLVEFIDTMDVRERNLFDNCQFRYLLSQGATDIDESHALEAITSLGSMDLVGTTERLYDFLLVLAFSMGWAPPPRAPHLNTGKKDYFFDLDNASEDLQARVERLTRLDKIVYQHAQTLFESRFRGMLKILSQNAEWVGEKDLNSTRLAEQISRMAAIKPGSSSLID